MKKYAVALLDLAADVYVGWQNRVNRLVRGMPQVLAVKGEELSAKQTPGLDYYGE